MSESVSRSNWDSFHNLLQFPCVVFLQEQKLQTPDLKPGLCLLWALLASLDGIMVHCLEMWVVSVTMASNHERFQLDSCTIQIKHMQHWHCQSLHHFSLNKLSCQPLLGKQIQSGVSAGIHVINYLGSRAGERLILRIFLSVKPRVLLLILLIGNKGICKMWNVH